VKGTISGLEKSSILGLLFLEIIGEGYYFFFVNEEKKP